MSATTKPNLRVIFRPYLDTDQRTILDLNAESVAVLSPLDECRFQALAQMSDMLQVADVDGQTIGFIMAFADNRAYDSINYRWFAARLKNFLYIDRVVLSPLFRRHGLGTHFYQQAQAFAQARGLSWLAVEVDIKPPNLASLEFHKKQGFMEIGCQGVGSGKIVSLQIKPLDNEK